MNTLGKSILISAAAAALAVASISPASADDWHHHGYYNNGWAVGAAGLATGLIVGSAIASQPRYVEPGYYYGDYPPPPPPYYYRAPRPVYVAPAEAYYPGPAYGLRPWSPQWMRYCSDRYQTFDGRTGTYVGYDGARHFCTAG
ncbi:BA14K family protein [Neorhizobium sp. P12A]|jgi:hypothetical protein|uniref:BA14K family protein n=1 Tax=Rhizobium/Agrobacterium group TaxID=227290 RepID=UPI001046FA70|nr:MULTISPECIES: BA14K family protein [Rhizobium/Agrobacterium group]KAA0700459.1 BA14K family protein [Neorhizobium sp. P12A]TCR92201.1 BA14K-like protein [Rhizobium sp. BK376]